MDDFLHAQVSQSVEIQSHISRRLVFHARNVARSLFLRKPRKDVNITDVKIIRNAILCPGRSHPQRNAQNVEAIWWKRGISLSAARKHVDM